MPPIVVCNVIESLGRGGAERRLVTDLKLIDRRRFRPLVVHLFPPDTLKDELEAMDVPVVSLGLASGRDVLPKGLPRLVRLLRDSGPPIVHSHLFWADIVARLAGKWAGALAVVSSAQASVYEPGVEHVFSNKRRWLDRLTGRLGCDGYIAVSNFVKESHVRWLGIKEEKVRVIPNALDVEALVDSVKGLLGRADVLRGLGIPENARVVVSVARLVVPKGQNKAIEAVAHLGQDGEEYHLLLVGEGPHRSRFESLARSLGVADRVHFLGVRNDVPAILKASDCFVLPSLLEGMPYALLEAMLFEVPCVASSIGPHREVIRHGESGWLLEPDNVKGLAEAISRVFLEPEVARHVAKQGRRVVEAGYNAAFTVSELEKFYLDMLGLRSQADQE